MAELNWTLFAAIGMGIEIVTLSEASQPKGNMV